MSRTTMQRLGGAKAISIRLHRGEHTVGMLLQLSNGRWAVYDRDERRLSKRDFLQPAMARDHFDEIRP